MRRLLVSFGVVGAAFAGGLVAGASATTAAWAEGREVYPALDTLARAMATIEGRHVEPVGSEALVHDAIRGMVEGLDPHSRFLSPEEYREMQDRTEGRWFGVGVELETDPRGARIVRVIPASPAALGDLQADDVLLQADGQTLAGLTLIEVVEQLHGERGEPLVLRLERDGDALERTVVRDQVISPTVSAALFAPGLGYARIEHFRQRTATELSQALGQLEAEGGEPLRGLVLDLRQNPGGLLSEAVGVVDLFVGDALVVETRRRGDVVDEQLTARSDASDRDPTVVVLVDGGSASASEIVAGALQVMERATVIGTRTWGKGSVQQVWEFEDGSALKLTVARYHLPDGRTITHEEGVLPDEVVPMAPERAALDAALDAVDDLSPEQRTRLETVLLPLMDEADGEPGIDGPVDIPWTGSLDERRALDPQLERAWQVLTTG